MTRLDRLMPRPPGSRKRSDTARQDRKPVIRPLPERVERPARDGDARAREHNLTLPSGRDRDLVRHCGRDYHLRGSEVDLLERTGRFRAVFTEDLKGEAGDPARFRVLARRSRLSITPQTPIAIVSRIAEPLAHARGVDGR